MAQTERRREITSSTCSKRSTQVIFRAIESIHRWTSRQHIGWGYLTVELTRYLRCCENSGIRIKKTKSLQGERRIKEGDIYWKYKNEKEIAISLCWWDRHWYIFISRTSEGPKGTKKHRLYFGRKFARQSIVAAKCGNDILAPFGYNGTCDTKLFNFWINASRTKTRTNRYYGQCINT